MPRHRNDVPELTGSYDGLDPKDVRRLGELAASLGMASLSIDELIELILRDGWKRPTQPGPEYRPRRGRGVWDD